jgi:hypothetical protein
MGSVPSWAKAASADKSRMLDLIVSSRSSTFLR